MQNHPPRKGKIAIKLVFLQNKINPIPYHGQNKRDY